WVHGWKSVFTQEAVCWHRVGASGRTEEGAGIRFQGTVAGRLLIATKLLPVRFASATWAGSIAGLARDFFFLRWRKFRSRAEVLGRLMQSLPALLRERRSIFSSQRTSPRRHLQRSLAGFKPSGAI